MAATDLRGHLVAYFEGQHKLVETDALTLLLTDRQPLVLSQQVLDRCGTGSPLVTREMVERTIELRRASRMVARAAPASVASEIALNSGSAPPFALLTEGFSPPVPNRDPLEAYGALFASRYQMLSRLLRGRPGLSNLRPIRELRSAEADASIIAMIRDVREVSAKRIALLTVEDPSGSTDLLVPNDAFVGRGTFLPDEVVGFTLRIAREAGKMHRVTSIERPEVPPGRAIHRADRPSRTLFLSDLHIGSRSFLSEPWARLMDFLHGRGPHAEIAETLEHVVIAGDLVDGIGIYPNQERDLAISDVVEQYAELGRRLRELPERLSIIVVPGNHDAVAPAEPQPALSAAMAAQLPTNVRSLGNPSTFALHGVVLSAYHGRGFDELIPAIPGASYGRPTDVMKRMLQMRHMAPIYGGRTPLAPLSRDGLVIEPLPDVFVTGHSHTYGVDHYRGVLLLNVSTWQGETEYQKMRNITPVPARAAIVDLATLSTTTLNFAGRECVLGGPEG